MITRRDQSVLHRFTPKVLFVVIGLFGLLAALLVLPAEAQGPPVCDAYAPVAVADTGTPGDDILLGTTGDDVIEGLGGNDIICGFGGNDTLTGGPGDDIIDGGDGDDDITGGAGIDNLSGNNGNDRVVGGEDADVIFGGAGNDRLSGQAGDDLVDGGPGDDDINGGDGADELRGGAGNDQLGPVDSTTGAIITGDVGKGDDFMSGGPGEDIISGGAGNDRLNGQDDDDFIDGGEGDDDINGGDGNDTLNGGPGNDTIGAGYGASDGQGLGDDILNGGDGDDVLAGGDGNDVIRGDAGNDQADGGLPNGAAETDDCIAETEINCEPDGGGGGGGGGPVNPPAETEEPVDPAQEITVTRIEGADNVATSIAWSQFANPTPSTGDNVVLLARDDIYPDSLASGALQGLLRAPLLLTQPDALDPRTRDELLRLNATRVILLGNEVALNADVRAAVEALGISVERVGGPTRLETSIEIADTYFADATTAIIVRGYGDDDDMTRGFADSLGVGGYGANELFPILHSETDLLSASTEAYLEQSDITTVLVIGGESALTQSVRDSLTGLGLTLREIAGDTRFDTATAVADDLGFPDASTAPQVFLVAGQIEDAWADGFTAALATTIPTDSPMVLAGTPGQPLPGDTSDYLEAGGVDLVCGAYVTAAQCDDAEALLEMPASG